MKMKCIANSIFRGDTVRRGTLLEVTEEEAKSDMVKANFVAVDTAGEPAPVATQGAAGEAPAPRVKTLVAGLTRDQALAKLRAAGANVKGNATNAAIVEIYNQTFANVAEATVVNE